MSSRYTRQYFHVKSHSHWKVPDSFVRPNGITDPEMSQTLSLHDLFQRLLLANIPKRDQDTRSNKLHLMIRIYHRLMAKVVHPWK